MLLSRGEARKLGERLRLADPRTANMKAPLDLEKTETAESQLSFYIQHLGTTVNGKYEKNPYCLDAVKNMLLINKRDEASDKMTVRRYLVRAGIVASDLFPALLEDPRDELLWKYTIWLMDELTMPPNDVALRIPKDRLQDNPNMKQYFSELNDRRQAAKKVFTDKTFFYHLREHLSKVLRQDVRERDRVDAAFIRHGFNLLANLLEMTGEVLGKSSDSPASLHNNVFRAMHESGLTGVIIYAACAEKLQAFRILDVIFYLLRNHNATELGKEVIGEKSCQARDSLFLAKRKQAEAEKRQLEIKALSRHPGFVGTLVLKGASAVNPENEMVVTKPLQRVLDSRFEITSDKAPQAKGRNRKIMKALTDTKSFEPINSPGLKTFCKQFLENAYNSFMKNLKDEIPHLMALKDSSEPEEYLMRYFWSLRFFMEFNRAESFQVDFVSETITQETFHFLLTKMETFLDMMKVQKDEIVKWSERIHLTLRAYQELLWTLSTMLSSPQENIRRAAKQLEINIFYQEEYREIFLALLREFTETKFTKSFLKDLIISAHIFIKLLEVYLQAENQKLFVKKKQKRRNVKKKVTKGRIKKASQFSKDERTKLWSSQEEKLKELLEKKEDVDTSACSPYDPLSEIPLNDQKNIAKSRMQNALLDKDSQKAVALLKASKEFWSQPDDLAFGTLEDPIEIDISLLKEILFAEINDVETVEQENIPDEVIDEGFDDQPVAHESDDDKEDGKPKQTGPKEVEFHLETFIKRFATAGHLEPYLLMLNYYKTNSFQVNHAILKMLHRVVWDLKLPGMLFQLSLFRLYQRIMKDSVAASGDPRFIKEFDDFMTFLLEIFFEQLRKNPKTILFVLFWKTRGEAHDLLEEPGEKQKPEKQRDATRTDIDPQLGLVSSVVRQPSPEDEDDVDFAERLRELGEQGPSKKRATKKRKKSNEKLREVSEESDPASPRPASEKRSGTPENSKDYERPVEKENASDSSDNEDPYAKLRRKIAEKKAKLDAVAKISSQNKQKELPEKSRSSPVLEDNFAGIIEQALDDSDDDDRIVSQRKMSKPKRATFSDEDEDTPKPNTEFENGLEEPEGFSEVAVSENPVSPIGPVKSPKMLQSNVLSSEDDSDNEWTSYKRRRLTIDESF